MIESLDKVIDTAKKLRKYTKKSTDPAFVNLIADLNVELAELRVQLAELRAERPQTTAAPQPRQQHTQPQHTQPQQAQQQPGQQHGQPQPAAVAAPTEPFESIFDDDDEQV